MQYAIMKQAIPGSSRAWHAVQTPEGDSLVYTSQEEALAKLTELQMNEPTLAQYKVESYQDNPDA